MKKETYKIKYGGAITGKAEYNALNRSIKKSIKSGNWQIAEEANLFCQEAASFLGVKYGAICNSGSSAGLLALAALELPRGSKVIIPAVTFPTIFNIIPQLGLIPVVVDCEVGTYNMDLKEVEQAMNEHEVRAIIAVHAVGNPVDMPTLMKMVSNKNVSNAVGQKHNFKKIYVIEDNCDGWGSSIGDKAVGSFGDISFTSFHAAHIVSMGVGGGVFTNNTDLARNVGMYRDWGRQANLTPRKNTEFPTLPEDQNPRFIYEKLGYNFNMLELQAAMGRVQLKKTEKIKKARKKNFNYLYEELSKFPDLILPISVPDSDVCWFSFPLSVKNNRSKLLNFLEDNGIETRTMFGGNILRHPAYKNIDAFQFGDLHNANWILEHSFWVSCHPRYKPNGLKYMVDLFKKYFNA